MDWFVHLRSSALAGLGRSKRPEQEVDGVVGAGTGDFSRVYRERLWGRKLRKRFYSGPGSHDSAVVARYIDAVRAFLKELPERPDVVDLGCGDFNVGRQLRATCGAYVACDVVDELIRHNRTALQQLHVDFRLVDIVRDPLPVGRVAFLRQVLQHLSNDQIASVLPKLNAFKYVVLTEHLSTAEDFQPNLDQNQGAGTRIAKNSGVVLTAPPFDFAPRTERRLCAVTKYGGSIVTTVYEMP